MSTSLTVHVHRNFYHGALDKMNTLESLEKPIDALSGVIPEEEKASVKKAAKQKPEQGMETVYIPILPGLEVIDEEVDGVKKKIVPFWVGGIRLAVPTNEQVKVPAAYAPVVKAYLASVRTA